MGLNLYVVLGSAVVGLLVGLTGAGGGALMTPMLILLFSVKPAAAISSDLVAAVVMRPVGAAVHLHKGTVNLRLVGWMSLGSVPMAFLGAYLLREMGNNSADQKNVEIALGAALLLGAAAMVLRYVLDRRSNRPRTGKIAEVSIRPVPTVLIGMVGGLIVGITSVGSGSLMIILLLFAYPMLSAGQLVGTDLTQAVPLTAAAALGALTFGHVEFGVTASIIAGSVPAVLIGSLLSSRAPDRYIRPAITFVILASGLKYVGVPTYPLGWTMGGILLAGAAYWLATKRPWQRDRRPAAALTEPAPALARQTARARRPGRRHGRRPSGPTRRPTRWTTCQSDDGRRSARVLLHHGAEVRQRGRDMLGRAAADGAVRLQDRGPLGDLGARIGHREQGLGHLVAALDQVVAEVGGTRAGEIRPVRLELVHHVRDQRFHDGLQVTRRERVRGLVGKLDRRAGDSGLAGDLLPDQLQAVGGYLRMDVGREQDLLKGGSHGALFSLSRGQSRMPVGAPVAGHTTRSPLGQTKLAHLRAVRYRSFATVTW